MPFPFYVTRKDADGLIGTLHVSMWFVLLSLLLGMANVALWGVVGIITAVEALL